MRDRKSLSVTYVKNYFPPKTIWKFMLKGFMKKKYTCVVANFVMQGIALIRVLKLTLNLFIKTLKLLHVTTVINHLKRCASLKGM